jgi:hypothetical protein
MHHDLLPDVVQPSVVKGLMLTVVAILFVSHSGRLASQSGRAEQTSVSKAKEKKAEEEVAKLVETLRQQEGLPSLRRIGDPHLRENACESAKRGKGTGSLYPLGPTKIWIPSGILGDVGNLSTFSYMALDPSETSPELQTWATQATYFSSTPARFAVGACFASTTEHPEGTYWIDVGYYMGTIKTFFYRFVWD